MLKIRVVKAMLRVTAAANISLLAALSASAQTVRYIHTDALGSVVLMTDKDRNVVERSEYEPYGSVLNHAVTDGPGYTGHVMDASTGLTYMQQRYYDPQIGILLSVDPIVPYAQPDRNFNRYNYAASNPYRYIDPDGRYQCTRNGGTCSIRDAAIAESYRATAIKAHGKMANGQYKERLGGALEKIGSPNDGNGFVINLTSLEKDRLGVATDNGVDLDDSRISEGATLLNISSKYVGAFVLGHEGSHKLDAMQPGVNSHYYPATGLERMLTEIRAYGMNSSMGNALGINNYYNVPGMSWAERRRRIWEGAKSSWHNACAEGGGGCSGYRP